MRDWVIRMAWGTEDKHPPERLLDREWIVTNGLGGYASGTIAGAATRRYHSLLVAALPSPHGRYVMLNHLMELVRVPGGTSTLLGGEELTEGGLRLHGRDHLREFRLEKGLPVWVYEVDGYTFEKRVLLPHQQNSVHIAYRLVSGGDSLRLKLRPSVSFRPHESPVSDRRAGESSVSARERRYEVVSQVPGLPPLRLYLYGADPAFTLDHRRIETFYRVEESRGYESQGDLWSPGYFRATLRAGSDVTLIASTESWDTLLALRPDEARTAEEERRERLLARVPEELRTGPPSALVLAADQFLITPAGRVEDAARARAAGEEVRSVIAGYHWFTDWGRDTMISLEGLTLTTGREHEARWILHTFAHYIRDGLLPNMFPEGEKEGLYHTADATLWFFHTVGRYVDVTGDTRTLDQLLPKLIDILRHHQRGTRFNIRMDPADCLLSQGEEGYQLTWMDAKVGDWVVTPRRGKAVEINALWYNAIRLVEEWVRERSGESEAAEWDELADSVEQSFNDRFWYEEGGYLYDVIDCDGTRAVDPAFRPNQIFAFSLAYPVLAEKRWLPVLNAVREKLLTPFGLRSLAPGHEHYKPKYYGDLRARDAAYHQGTVWAWLVGPFIDAWLRVYPEDKSSARQFLNGFVEHLNEACLGSISEIFDAEAPYTARGCIAQAWSVAEVLRCYFRTL